MKEKIDKILVTICNEARDKINSLDNKLKNPQKDGKKGSKLIESGKMATELAKDMLKMQKPDQNGGGKANSLKYNVLQAKLAYFPLHRDELRKYMIEIKLIDSTNPHPFIKKIDFERQSLIEFYKFYYTAKITYINKVRKKLCESNNLNELINNHRFLKINLSNSPVEGAKELMKKPINLPRGLFIDACNKVFFDHPDYRNLLKAPNQNKPNHSSYHLMKTILTSRYNKDSNQSFYGYDRVYADLFKQMPDDKIKISKDDLFKYYHKNYESTSDDANENVHEIKKRKLQLALRKAIANETTIREMVAQDMLLFLLVKYQLENSEAGRTRGEVKLRLSEINPLSKTPYLDQISKFEVMISFRQKNCNTTTNRTVKIINDSLKIKDFGKLRRFAKDRRLPGYFSYSDKDSYHYDEIVKELEKYDQYRISISEAIYKLESTIYDNDKNYFDGKLEEDMKKRSNSGEGLVSHTVFLEYLKGKGVPDEETRFIRIIRNSFMHNQYPILKDLNECQKTLPNNLSAVNYLYEEFCEIMARINDKIK